MTLQDLEEQLKSPMSQEDTESRREFIDLLVNTDPDCSINDWIATAIDFLEYDHLDVPTKVAVIIGNVLMIGERIGRKNENKRLLQRKQ